MIIRDLMASLLSVLSYIALPDEFSASIINCISWFMWGNYYLPLDTFINCATFIISFWIIAFIVKWVVQLLH